MSPPVFHLEAAAEVRAGEPCVLDGTEGHHASVVRRVRIGEHLMLTNGRGVAAEVEVTWVERGRVGCRVVEVRSTDPSALLVTVVQAIPKGDRGVLAVDLLTEVGVDQIVPWQAERCVSRWQGVRAERGRAKWSAAAREAAKQSRRAWWPVVAPVARYRRGRRPRLPCRRVPRLARGRHRAAHAGHRVRRAADGRPHRHRGRSRGWHQSRRGRPARGRWRLDRETWSHRAPHLHRGRGSGHVGPGRIHGVGP